MFDMKFYNQLSTLISFFNKEHGNDTLVIYSHEYKSYKKDYNQERTNAERFICDEEALYLYDYCEYFNYNLDKFARKPNVYKF
jgi:hypothetical protein